MNFRQLCFYAVLCNCIGGGITAAFDDRLGKTILFSVIALVGLIGTMWPERAKQ